MHHLISNVNYCSWAVLCDMSHIMRMM